MNKEDYFKYYIQGSDHYLIPKDIFIELFDEMENWREEAKELKEKYLNAVADYETTMFEKEQLNILVNSCQEEIRQLKKQVEQYQQELEKADSITQSCIFHGKEESKISYRKCLNILDKKETQQKEFIEYLKHQVKLQEELNDIHLATGFEEILQKYKEIIGGK